MNRRTTLYVIIAAQVACMAVGLWVHYLCVTATLVHESQETARAELASLAQGALQKLDGPTLAESSPADRKQLTSILLTAAGDAAGHLTLTDSNWALLASSADVPPSVNFAAAHWMEPLDFAGKPARGTIPSASGGEVAVAYFLGPNGYLIAHRPAVEIAIGLHDIVPSLITAGLVTFAWTCGLFGIAVYMIVSHQHDKMSRKNNQPEVEALKRAQALVRTQETVIFGLAKLSDSRDGDTGDHLERISFYCSSLATAMRQHPEFRDVVNPAFVQLIGISSALHDIGKVGVEDAILRKPGLLTKNEYERMKRHTTVGEECLKEIERRLGTSNFLKMAREIASFHHERWDGRGYPYGLKGEQIPLAARITAIADVYDALSSNRVYKKAYPHEKCVAIIRDEAGKHFDPRLVEVFLQIEGTFRDIAHRFAVPDAAVEESAELELREAARDERDAEEPVAVG